MNESDRPSHLHAPIFIVQATAPLLNGSWGRRHAAPVRERSPPRGSAGPRLLAPAVAQLHPSWSDPKRHAQYAGYLSLFLFGLLNPVLKTMRALCVDSQWQRVRRKVCTQSLSLGSFSEAQHLVEPAALAD